jgi:DNA-binding IclR family transcriptional regulator
VTSVDKALEVLLLLGQERGIGVREMARRLGMSAPTVYRLLTRLAAHGLVQQVPGRPEYRLGWACLDLARNALADVGLVQIGTAVAQDLRDATRETVTIQVPAERDHICVVEVEGLDEIRRRVGIGRRMALHAGASGRAILAYMPQARIDDYVSKPMDKITATTLTDPVLLEEVLTEIRANGYAVSQSESVVGAVAISAPAFGDVGLVEGSISISGPESRLTPDVVERFTPMVVEAGRQLSERLGYSDPTRQLVGTAPVGTARK